MSKYDPTRDTSAHFISKVMGWISESGEVLVVLRYLASAGAKDFIFCRTQEEFTKLVESVAIGTDIIVFQEPQLPTRGSCTQSFIESTLRQLAACDECLVVRVHLKVPQRLTTSGQMSDSPECLKEILEGLLGEEVAVGPCPNFNVADHETMISAAKGGIDGPR